MNTMEESLNYIVNEAVKRLQKKDEGIMVEASGRHAHLSKELVEILFGKGYKLTQKRELSQPGQYLCEEKIMIIGPKGTIQNISVLGPEREETQIELSQTDAVSIGVKAPVKMSGDIENSSSVIIATQNEAVKLEKGVIVAKRHMHITPEDAGKYGVSNNEEINIKINGERGVIFTNVAVRVSSKFNTVVHIDYDEANACGFIKGMKATIV